MSAQISPCSHCRSTRVSFKKNQGVAGRVTRTPFYRETVACQHCNIEVISRTPGNAVAFWNRSFAALPTLIAELQGEDRWKDISTAPKDGTYILVHQKGVPEPSTTVCCWDEAWGIGGWWMCCDGKNPELPLRGPGPTLWHPIPALKGGLNGK